MGAISIKRIARGRLDRSTDLEIDSIVKQIQDVFASMTDSTSKTPIQTAFSGKASDSEMLDGHDSSYFAVATHLHDGRYLGLTAKAADSNLFDGLDSTAFSLVGHNHDSAYLGLHAKADDSNLLDGLDSAVFARKDVAQTIGSQWSFSINPTVAGGTNWYSGNDGAGSGLDADLWDGNQFSNYLNQAVRSTDNPTFAGEILTGLLDLRDNITQTKNKSYSSSGFTSGWLGSAGFKLSTNSAGLSQLEIDNLNVRGTAKFYELLIQQLRVQNGNYMFSDGAKLDYVAEIDFYDQYITGRQWQFTTSDNIASPFVYGDFVTSQRFTGESVYRLIGMVTSVSGSTVDIAFEDRYNVDMPSDVYALGIHSFEFARLGNYTDADRQGNVYIETNKDDGSATSTVPSLKVYNGIASISDWMSGIMPKVSLGNINGLNTPEFGELSGYGLYAQNAYLSGILKVLQGSDVAGWLTTATTLNKGTTRLEASAAFKGLGIGDGTSADYIKIGEFADETPTVTTTDRSREQQPNPNTVDANNWRLVVQYYNSSSTLVNLNPTCFGYNQQSYLGLGDPIQAGSINGANGFTFKYTYTSYNINRVMGKDFKLGFTAEFNGTQDYCEDSGTFDVEARYYNSSGTYLFSKKIFTQVIPANVPQGYVILNELLDTKLPIIQGATKIDFVFMFWKDGTQNPTKYDNPYSFLLKSALTFQTYEKMYTRINNDKVQFYQSPSNIIEFSGDAVQFNCSAQKSNGVPTARFFGRLATAPTTLDSAIIGDLYINSTDSKVYMCTNFNASSGLLDWTALN